MKPAVIFVNTDALCEELVSRGYSRYCAVGKGTPTAIYTIPKYRLFVEATAEWVRRYILALDVHYIDCCEDVEKFLSLCPKVKQSSIL